jgi:DNA-binding response OmpR family regulator
VVEVKPEKGQRTARRVLLVEDHHDSREFMQALLESDGHQVDTATGIQEAKGMLEKAIPVYEVLVTDIGLADGSGWDLIVFARERWPSMRIGVVTGWEPRAGAGADGAGDFILRKPVRTSELLAQVAGER